MNRKGPWEGYRGLPSFARTFSSKERRLGTRQPQATSMVEGAELASLRASFSFLPGRSGGGAKKGDSF